MGIGVTEEHASLTEAVHGWARRHAPISTARDDDHAGAKARPPYWDSLAAQGLVALHLPERHGGAGGDVTDLAVAVEALGRSLVAGPHLPTVITSTLLAMTGQDDLLPGLADGTLTGATSFGEGPVLGAAEADILVLPFDGGWHIASAGDVSLTPHSSLDATRSLATVTLLGPPQRRLPGVDAATVRQIAVTLASAEAAGLAAWCLDTAVEHAKVREQFGRPIGQFQAIKHACADMLVKVEQARAVAWDAARAVRDASQRPLAAAVAGAVALDAAVECAKRCIQILGGIGFTWEHDAHLYLRRAIALRQLLGPTSAWRADAARLARAGGRRTLRLELGGADETRAEVRHFLASISGLDDAEQRRRMADSGYIAPHWPTPFGHGADAVEQLVIEEEFRAAGVRRPDLVVAGWIVPTLIAFGTAAQQERFVTPTLRGEMTWCQLFSEPGAGSDLAALQTKATRTEGGWLLSGQKVWTSLAHSSDYGLCLARTDPTTASDAGASRARKHDGITCFVVDMRADGIDIRPLREITGREMFNEVFLNDVLVPDDCVVGDVNDGWRAGRTTLSNERVAMSSGPTMGAGVEAVLRLVGPSARPAREAMTPDDAVIDDRIGALVAEGQALALLGLRTTLRQVGGIDPGAAASVRKLVGMHHAQDCAELALELLGPAGATVDGAAEAVTHGFLQSRCLTIAGGTTEVQRNVIAERLLGLPRDP